MSIQWGGLHARKTTELISCRGLPGPTQRARTPSPQPDSQPPSQQAAYTPPEAWSAEWMEQHPNPDFRATLQDLLDAGYCWPEEVRDVQRGSHNLSLVRHVHILFPSLHGCANSKP
eukprot:1158085-Pelagomonas_calceolata.AAC.11